MNEFEYALKVKELHTLTTKKSKVEFIRQVKSLASIYNTDILTIKLLLEIQVLLPKTITGVKGIPQLIAGLSFQSFSKEDKVTLVSLIPKENVTATNDYNRFMCSSGIPAYLKLAVLQAENK